MKNMKSVFSLAGNLLALVLLVCSLATPGFANNRGSTDLGFADFVDKDAPAVTHLAAKVNFVVATDQAAQTYDGANLNGNVGNFLLLPNQTMSVSAGFLRTDQHVGAFTTFARNSGSMSVATAGRYAVFARNFTMSVSKFLPGAKFHMSSMGSSSGDAMVFQNVSTSGGFSNGDSQAVSSSHFYSVMANSSGDYDAGSSNVMAFSNSSGNMGFLPDMANFANNSSTGGMNFLAS